MTVQNNVLQILIHHSDTYTSGQDIADNLNVSRNAVWKATKQLKEAGYAITSTVKGYKLEQLTPSLDAPLLQSLVDGSFTVETYDSVTSTNDLVRQKLIEDPTSPVVFAANKQTKGRGRRGRSFYSEIDQGLYFSIGFQPKMTDLQDMTIYSIIAATALCEAIEPHLDSPLSIKWVNDIFYKNRKVIGILSELITQLEDDTAPQIVVGMGINLAGSFDQSDEDTRSVAGTLFDKTIPESFNQNTVLADIIKNFFAYENDPTFIDKYKQRLLGLNKTVTYSEADQSYTGIIRDLDDKGRLIVENPDGSLKRLLGQEIHFSSKQFIEEE